LPKGVGAVFWFIVWVFLIRVMVLSRFRSLLGLKLTLLFIISILLIFGTAYHIDVRRVMAVYPILYVVAVNHVVQLNQVAFRFWVLMGTLAYLAALVLYLIVKS
jgi:hypothetical protein